MTRRPEQGQGDMTGLGRLGNWVGEHKGWVAALIGGGAAGLALTAVLTSLTSGLGSL
jgi:hypothetical protein